MYDKELFERCCVSPIGFECSMEQVREEILDGFRYRACSIWVSPGHVELLAELAKEHGNGFTRLGMIDNYPYGGFTTEYKVYLAQYALQYGLDEICLGVNIAAFLEGDIPRFKDDIQQVLDAVQGRMDVVPLTWAIRIPLEKLEEIINIYLSMGIRRIKTSPGVRFGQMEQEHIQFIRRVFGDQLEIEVSGRVRSRNKVEKFIDCGADHFHLGSWRRICFGMQDRVFNWETKKSEFGAYRDRL